MDRSRVVRRVVVLVLVAAAVAPLAPGQQRLRRRPVKAVTPTSPGWHNEQTLGHGGINRYFRYFVPLGMQPGAPVVVLLHGGTQSMRDVFSKNAGGTQE